MICKAAIHESAHAVVFTLCGAEVVSVELFSDTSGITRYIGGVSDEIVCTGLIAAWVIETNSLNDRRVTPKSVGFGVGGSQSDRRKQETYEPWVRVKAWHRLLSLLKNRNLNNQVHRVAWELNRKRYLAGFEVRHLLGQEK
jgi:hypothetical protein